MTAISAAALYQRPGTPAAVYRRRRLAFGAALIALVVLLSLAGGWGRGASGGGPLTASGGAAPATLSLQTVSADTYVVAAGDTLWSIARGLQPEGDVRPLVDALAASRDGRPLQVGERIRLP